MARLVVPDVPHHVTHRGNRRQPFFFNDEDYAAYLALVSEACDVHRVVGLLTGRALKRRKPGRRPKAEEKIGIVSPEFFRNSWVSGLITAPTGAGPVAAGIVAIGSRGVSMVANTVSFAANIVDGNARGARRSFVGIVAGQAGGRDNWRANIKVARAWTPVP